MGLVLWAGQGVLMPYVHGTWALRIGALAVLVMAGMVVYGLATLVLGAFTREDLALLTRRRRAAPANKS
jgi:putative peptidoglycan lipid II flippase